MKGVSQLKRRNRPARAAHCFLLPLTRPARSAGVDITYNIVNIVTYIVISFLIVNLFRYAHVGSLSLSRISLAPALIRRSRRLLQLH